MMQRAHFLVEFSSYLYTMSELCARYWISRKTYKRAGRWSEEEAVELEDLSRRPKSCPRQTRPEVEERLVELRRQRPSWDPRKLLAFLQSSHPEVCWPAASMIGDALKRHGSVSSGRTSFASAAASPDAVEPGHPAQCGLDWRFQGPVPDRRSSAVLPADGGRCLQPVCVGGCRAGLGEVSADLEGVRASLPGVRASRSDSNRQREPVCLDLDGSIVALVGPLAETGNPAGADRSRASGAEREPRTDASEFGASQRRDPLEGTDLFVSEALVGERVGLEEVEEGIWSVYG